MKTFIFFLLFILILEISTSYAQSLNEFYGKRWLGIGYYRSHIKNVVPAGLNGNTEGIAYNFSFGSIQTTLDIARRDQTKSGAFHYDWRYPVMDDLWGLLYYSIARNDKDPRPNKFDMLDHSLLSAGWIGFHNFGKNIIGSDKLVISTGLNLSDFNFASNHYSIVSMISPEMGYYFTVGPYAHCDILPVKWFMLRVTAQYCIPYYKYINKGSVMATYTEGTENVNPHFFLITPEIISKWGLYISADLWYILHKKSALQYGRQSISFGWRFGNRKN